MGERTMSLRHGSHGVRISLNLPISLASSLLTNTMSINEPKLWINGEEVASEVTFERCDPHTGAVVTRAPAATKEHLEQAVQAAQAAFTTWKCASNKATLLRDAANKLEGLKDELIAMAVTEIGATAPWIGFNVHLATGMLRAAAGLSIEGKVLTSGKPGCTSLALRRPHGVCLAIAPWNAPIILSIRSVATALACGNTVIFKTSDICPGVHLMLAKIFADFPPGVVNLVSVASSDAPSHVAAIIENPLVKHVNFTGSTAVGRKIAVTAAENLKPVLLELGGKAPLLVRGDCGPILDDVVNAICFGSILNAGQICMATEQIIAHADVAEVLTTKLVAKMSKLPYGASTGHVVVGNMVSKEAAQRMQTLVDDAVSKGAKVLYGGGPPDGSIYPPTILTNLSEDMLVATEEIFGPLTCVWTVSSDDEAIAMANDTTAYGLSAAIFGTNLTATRAVAAKINSGIVHINGPTVNDEPQVPFGGVGASGYGRFGGEAGIEAFTTWQWSTMEDPGQHYPF